eukprot:COSAG02_NODE_54626_length_295_cov_0.683673_1_plen_73_part_01
MLGCNVTQTEDGVDRCTQPPSPVKGHKYNTVRGYTQGDQREPDGTWTKNPKCPRSKVWIVYENCRACEPTYTR